MSLLHGHRFVLVGIVLIGGVLGLLTYWLLGAFTTPSGASDVHGIATLTAQAMALKASNAEATRQSVLANDREADLVTNLVRQKEICQDLTVGAAAIMIVFSENYDEDLGWDAEREGAGSWVVTRSFTRINGPRGTLRWRYRPEGETVEPINAAARDAESLARTSCSIRRMQAN